MKLCGTYEKAVYELANYYLNEVLKNKAMESYLVVRALRGDDNTKLFKQITNESERIIRGQNGKGCMINELKYIYIINTKNKRNIVKVRPIKENNSYFLQKNEIVIYEINQMKVISDIVKFDLILSNIELAKCFKPQRKRRNN